MTVFYSLLALSVLSSAVAKGQQQFQPDASKITVRGKRTNLPRLTKEMVENAGVHEKKKDVFLVLPLSLAWMNVKGSPPFRVQSSWPIEVLGRGFSHSQIVVLLRRQDVVWTPCGSHCRTDIGLR